MPKYGGVAGVYYYKTKGDAKKAAESARASGYRASVSAFFDLWEVVVRPMKKMAKRR